jgi:glycosyltransferase involved in cell wall biosynthesis
MTGRVLFISGEYPPMRGGIGDYTEQLVDALAETGWDARVLVDKSAGGNPDPRVLARIPRWDWSLTRRVQQTLRGIEADVIHIQYQTGAFGMHPAVNLLPRRLERRYRRPIVTTFHDLLPPYLFPKAGRLRSQATRLLALGSDAVIVTNVEDRAALGRLARLAGRVEIIPIGSNLPPADPELVAAARAHLELGPDELAIGFFGFLTAEKGLDLLLEALQRLGDPRLRLVIVGGGLAETDLANATYFSRLQAALAQPSVPVTRTGHLPAAEASAVLSATDLIVLPFRSGASLRRGTLIAALLSGVPVLTTDPGVENVLEPFVGGESLWLVPSSDVDALAAGIATLLANPALRRALAVKARAEAEPFEWRSIAGRHVEIYERLASDRTPVPTTECR